MRIKVNQEFRVPRSLAASQSGDFLTLCRGRHNTGVNPNRGIFYYAPVVDAAGSRRLPAFILYSDNVGGLSAKNPWLDIIDAEDGYALYHGDNKTSGTPPLKTPGNSMVAEIAHQYRDRDLRVLAPPMILFERTGNRNASYRKFVGYGIPRELRIQSQGASGDTFTNLAIELILFSLTTEGEEFDWNWIDQRRDASVSPSTALKAAPAAWKYWVKRGDTAIESSRRRVFGATIRSPKEQRQAVSEDEQVLIERIYKYYGSNKYAFEGLGSWVASRVLGPNCSRGWVTPRVDGGIDFVSRMDLGTGFAKTVVVVLGQAKCIRPIDQVRGLDLARTVARLKRGWIGVVVTTGTFSIKAQQEVLSDQYPLVLIDGPRLSQEVRAEMSQNGLTLEQVLDRETDWYESNQSALAADRVVFGDHWGQPA